MPEGVVRSSSGIEDKDRIPQKFFQKSGLQLKLLMSESPAWSDFRERFIKIMMMKLDDIGHVPQKGTSATVASSEVDIIQEYVKEGRRLYGLCHDIGTSQSNLDHAELGTLFALPEFATQAFIKRIPQQHDEREIFINGIKESGALDLKDRDKFEKLANAIMVTMWEPIERRLAPSFRVLRMTDPRSQKPRSRKRKSKNDQGQKNSRSRTTTHPKKPRNSNPGSSSDVQIQVTAQNAHRNDLQETMEQSFPAVPISQRTESQTELSFEHEESPMHCGSTSETIFLSTDRAQDLQSPRSLSKSPQHGPLRPETTSIPEDQIHQAPQPPQAMVSDGLTCLNIHQDGAELPQPVPNHLFHMPTDFSLLEPDGQTQTSPEFNDLVRLNMHQGGYPLPDTLRDFDDPTNFAFSDAHNQALETSMALEEMTPSRFDELIRINMHQGGVPVPEISLNFHNSAGFSFSDPENQVLGNLGEMASPGVDELIRVNMHQGGHPLPDTLLNFYNPTNNTCGPHSQAVETPISLGELEPTGVDEHTGLDINQGAVPAPDTLLNLYNQTNLAFIIPSTQTIGICSESAEPAACRA
ncbi:hypothetical protein BO71DRAFT_24789 [Aspergillus ellipticus CBS 707.79]|uniref:Uncharacterized protein n=1 Tax=Aspergillus ellipticus CBS 707.79 TaxID=1448320 RepID=A0A319DXC7_9EURO|nr:hypothetical protein BO71DRAFT_24789 [Aspergillus ellipticus CBS 707.79]